MKLKELLNESVDKDLIKDEIEEFAGAFTGILNDKLIDQFYDGKPGALRGKFSYKISGTSINITVKGLDVDTLDEYHTTRSLQDLFYSMGTAGTARCETSLCDEDVKFKFSGLKLSKDTITYKLTLS